MANGRKHEWRSRITRYGEETPDQLLAHPLNWRLHGKDQQSALSGVLESVGVVQNVIVNERTGHVVDGHLRITLAMRSGQATIPVTYVDLDESEEALILATLDPIAALASTDAHNLTALLDEVSTSDAAVMAMLSQLAEQEGIIPPYHFDPNAEWQGMPSYDNDDMTPATQVIVKFASEADVDRFARLVEQNVTMSTKGIWFPANPRNELTDIRFVGDADAA